MCGRYSVFDEESILEMRKIVREVEKNFSVPEPDAVQGTFAPDGSASFALSPIKTGEIAPTDPAPVLMPLPDFSGYRAVPMRWGFPRPGGEKGVIFNARSETAATLPLFRRSLRERRIAVPSTGFYEWDRLGGTRRRFLFRPVGEKMLYMAGFFNLFSDGFGEYPAFVILTRPAAGVIARYHHRMPVVLSSERVEEWLFDDGAVPALLRAEIPLEAQPS
ncbi:MAG: SOS response-associated peptidase [Clostridia bacterium]|nr:SOS response-associated peptidase [Clostridia bacterium]